MRKPKMTFKFNSMRTAENENVSMSTGTRENYLTRFYGRDNYTSIFRQWTPGILALSVPGEASPTI